MMYDTLSPSFLAIYVQKIIEISHCSPPLPLTPTQFYARIFFKKSIEVDLVRSFML